MKTAILIPVWKRPEITEVCFNNLAKTGCDVYAGVSEQWAKEMSNYFDFNTIEVDNDFLGRKKNKLMRAALDGDWDQIMEVGTDNLLDLDALEEYLSIPAPHYGTNCQYMYDTKTGRAKYNSLSSGRMWGTGRVISRQAVEEAVPLWDDKANRYMDAQANSALDRAGYTYSVVGYPIHCGMKSDVNIHPYDRFRGKPVNQSKLEKIFPELKMLTEKVTLKENL